MKNRSPLKNSTLEIFWFLLYFLIPYQGLVLVLQQYFSLERPGLSFYLIIGLASAIVPVFYEIWLKKRSVKAKIIGLIILLAVFSFTFLFVT